MYPTLDTLLEGIGYHTLSIELLAASSRPTVRLWNPNCVVRRFCVIYLVKKIKKLTSKNACAGSRGCIG